MRELMQNAAALGVRVIVTHMDDLPDTLGYYSHERRVIALQFGLTPFEMRSVLAHELGHAYYGDACSSGRNERRAERYAAQLLITPEAYAEAEREHGDAWSIAEELNVTVDVVETYQAECIQRLGRTTYGKSWRTGISPSLARKLSI